MSKVDDRQLAPAAAADVFPLTLGSRSQKLNRESIQLSRSSFVSNLSLAFSGIVAWLPICALDEINYMNITRKIMH